MEKRAYNALLTLLDSPPSKKQKVNEISVSKDTQNLEDIEGLESADNSESEEEIDAVDDNEGDLQDPFEFHFADPPEIHEPPQFKTVKTEILGTKSLVNVPTTELFKLNLSPVKLQQHLKHRLKTPFQSVNGKLTSLQKEYAIPLFNYMDCFATNVKVSNHQEYLQLTILHLLNHIYKTRDRVLKNNVKIKQAQLEKKELTLQDQGFTRPKVLVILPTRDHCYKFVLKMLEISNLKQSENKKRFKDAFYLKTTFNSTKPIDFEHLFSGNTNEVFCLGVKFTKQSVKLYSNFYKSDLIIASPLGLRLIVDQKKDFDFLSSIEIVFCDMMHALAMQSFTNLKIIFSKLNLMPKDQHDCDFSRVRMSYLNENAKFLRQTILLSEYLTPEMLSLFNKHCVNYAGRLRSKEQSLGVIANSGIHIKQTFIRTGVHSFSMDSNKRLEYFTNSLLPSLLRSAQNDGILVVAPNYTDFVVLRNYLEKNDFSYVSLSEYTQTPQLGRGRTFFADGRAKIMLYSARLHHYRRYGIKGVKTVVFYGLPDNPIFYLEFLRSLARTVIEKQIDPDLLRMVTLYSKWDALKLERVVGTAKMPALMEGLGDTYEFS